MTSTRELTFLGLWVDKLKMFCKGLSCEKQLCWRGAFSSASRWTHYRFVFLLFVLTMKCIFRRKWKVLLLGKDGTICSSFKINTTSWVLHLTKMSDVFFWLCTSHIDHDMFCFFLMERMTGAGWCCRSGTLSTLFGNAP